MMASLRLQGRKFKNRYYKLWKNLRGWRLFFFYILHYTAIFSVLFVFYYMDFSEAGRTLIHSSDGMYSYFPRLIYLSQTFRNGIQSLLSGEGWAIPLYDFRLGPAKLDLQVEPIQWLAVLWPWDKVDVLYDVLVIMRYYFVGLSFSIFGFYFKQSYIPVLIGAVSYTFCGFALIGGGKHPFFLSPMIFLPLLVIGTEKIIKKESPWLFILIVFTALVSNLYFACMLAILMVIYIFTRFPALYNQNRFIEFRNMVCRFFVAGGLGVALSGIFVFPSMIQMLESGRIGRDVTTFVDLWNYPDSYYQSFFSEFFVASGYAGYWTCLGFSVLTVPAILRLFVHKNKERRSLQILFIILTIMLWIPAIGYLMSGFNTISNRWCFAYAFCTAAILTFEIPCFFEDGASKLLLVFGGITVYFAICYFIMDRKFYSEIPFVMLGCCIVLFVLFRLSNCRNRILYLLVCLLITCFSIRYTTYNLNSPTQENNVSNYILKEKPYEYLEQSQYESVARIKEVKNDKTLFRVSGNHATKAGEVSTSFYTGTNGLSFYSSTVYQSYMAWIAELELAHLGVNNYHFGIFGRAPMQALASVKYYVMRETGDEVVPYGFEKIGRVQNEKGIDFVLKNNYFLPMGYSYDSFIPVDNYKTLSSLEKQEVQLQSIVLAEPPTLSNIHEDTLTLTTQHISSILTDWRNISWKDGVLKVKEEGATLTLTFDGLPNSETYLRIVNLDLTNGGSTRRWKVSAATEATKADAYFTADGYVYSNDMKTQLLDLGYTEDGYTTCTITFPSKGTFKLEDLEIWCQPMDHYGEQIDALREEVLDNIETNWRGLTGTISVSKDKMLCLAIPYDKGWTAYVDGEKVKLYQANTAFMAVELSAGDHEVDLRYWMPGLTAGIVLSSFGIVGVVAFAIYRRKKLSRRTLYEHHAQ